MKFSILVPVYNVKEYIEECLGSVLSQDFDDYEIIIIDDGSSDGSGEICDNYQGGKVKVIHKSNEGLLKARRDAIRVAQGEYCIFLDSDDKLSSDCLKTIDKYLEESIDLLIYNLYLWNPYTNQVLIREPVFKDEKLFCGDSLQSIRKVFLTSDILNNLVIKTVKTSILKADTTDYSNGIFTDFGEDAIQSFHIFDQCKSIKYIPYPLYYYRTNENSITRSYKPYDLLKQSFGQGVEILRNDYMKKWGLADGEIRRQVSVNRLECLRTVFSTNYLKINKRKIRKSYLSHDWSNLILQDNFEYLRIKNLKLTHFYEISCILNKNYFSLEIIRAIRILKLRIKQALNLVKGVDIFGK